MKRALVAVSFELLEQILQLPPGLKILRVDTDIRHPYTVVMLCEGDCLPASCIVINRDDAVPVVQAIVHAKDDGDFSHYTFTD